MSRFSYFSGSGNFPHRRFIIRLDALSGYAMIGVIFCTASLSMTAVLYLHETGICYAFGSTCDKTLTKEICDFYEYQV